MFNDVYCEHYSKASNSRFTAGAGVTTVPSREGGTAAGIYDLRLLRTERKLIIFDI